MPLISAATNDRRAKGRDSDGVGSCRDWTHLARMNPAQPAEKIRNVA
jgi:hypothetical protein